MAFHSAVWLYLNPDNLSRGIINCCFDERYSLKPSKNLKPSENENDNSLALIVSTVMGVLRKSKNLLTQRFLSRLKSYSTMWEWSYNSFFRSMKCSQVKSGNESTAGDA